MNFKEIFFIYYKCFKRCLTKELGLEICNLSLLLLTKENCIETYFFEKNLSMKLYNVIRLLSVFMTGDLPDRLYPVFFFLNLATKREFHLIIGQYVFLHQDNNNNLETFIQNFQNNFSFLLSYIRIFIPFFIDALVLYIYEVEADSIMRKFCFIVVAGLLGESARFNSFSLKDDSFIEKIMLYLRIEKDDFLKKTFVKLIKSFLKDNFILKILKAFLSKKFFF